MTACLDVDDIGSVFTEFETTVSELEKRSGQSNFILVLMRHVEVDRNYHLEMDVWFLSHNHM